MDIIEEPPARPHPDKAGRLLAAMAASSNDAIIGKDLNGTVLFWNDVAAQVFGFSAEEMIGAPVFRIVPPERAAAEASIPGRLQRGERVSHFETERSTKDGRTIPVSLTVSPIRDEDGRIVGTSEVVRDLSDTRHTGIGALLEQRELLIHASRMDELGHMAAALAHEVDQPLTAIANYARGARRLLKPEAPPALHEAIAKMEEQAVRAHKIVQSVRGMVKKETRPVQTENLQLIIEETSVLALIGAQRSVSLALKLDPGARFAAVDRVQIQQVLLNLMRNAVQAMAGCPLQRLTVATVRQGDRVEISVSDTGRGLPDSVRTRLFQPFVTTRADGLGVGLSICRAIVQAHGGELHAESRPGGGTAFHFAISASAAPPALL